jgi:hypothetical protein
MPWVTERIPCPQCFGGWTKCSSCFGSGYYYEPCASCPGGKECSFCNGRGTQTCSRCSGLCSIMQEVWHDDPPTSAPSATQLPTTHWKTPASRDIAPPGRARPPGGVRVRGVEMSSKCTSACRLQSPSSGELLSGYSHNQDWVLSLLGKLHLRG